MGEVSLPELNARRQRCRSCCSKAGGVQISFDLMLSKQNKQQQKKSLSEPVSKDTEGKILGMLSMLLKSSTAFCKTQW